MKFYLNLWLCPFKKEYLFLVLLRIFHSHWGVTIADEGLQNIYAKHFYVPHPLMHGTYVYKVKPKRPIIFALKDI
jgi:hypothetical protein